MPAHNEEQNISDCLQSLQQQTYQNFYCVVVDDGSSDDTDKIVESFVNQYNNYTLLKVNSSKHEPGAKVVRAFNFGLQSLDWNAYDVICKYDADIIFPPDYLEKLNEVYEQDSKIGMLSGLVYIQNSEGKWEFENLSSKEHVRGPIKSYRKECFKDIGGLRAVLGWDNIDVMLAKKHHWEVSTIKDLWVKHLRPTAYKYRSAKAEKLGQYFHNIGLSFHLAAISSLKSSWKNRSVSEFFITMKSFLSSKEQLVLTPEEVQYIRKLRWSEMFKKFL